MGKIGDRLMHAWNAFTDQKEEYRTRPFDLGAGYSMRPDRTRFTMSNERSIISSIYNRLAVDVAAIDIRHVRLDESKRYLEDIESGLNECLTLEANIDQAGAALIQDAAMTMFDRGSAVIVPVDTTLNPELSSGYDIKTMRIGEVVQWMPRHVRVSLYNDTTGRREEITLEKKNVAVVDNPFYSVMNETNSTLQRIIRKLNLLDYVDEQASSGKLDLIIQLPYVIKSESRRQQAEQRRTDIELQLKGSKYGIAYTDGTEKITQLNRPIENNLLAQVEWLLKILYSQLGLTEEIMNGTADEKAMLNYMNRTVEPVVSAIVDAMRRSFLTKTARSQKQSIAYFRDPFRLVPLASIAEIADKFTRNEIMSSNEIRQAIGMKPSNDPKADKLQNSNMPQPGEIPVTEPAAVVEQPDESTDIVNSAYDDMDKALDEVFSSLEVPLDE